MTKPAYSLAEARALAGVGRTTLYKAIRAGDLRAIKIGGRTFVLADDLHRWLNGMPPFLSKRSPPRQAASPARKHTGGFLWAGARDQTRRFEFAKTGSPMTVTQDEEFDPFSGPFGLERDLPLSFHFRTDPSEMATLRLPPARSPSHEDARNAVLTEAKLTCERNCWVSFSRRRAFYVGRSRYYGDSFGYDSILSAVADGVNAELLEEERARPGSRGRQSRFRGTPHLCELLDDRPIRSQLHECIWLRDNHRRQVNYVDTALTRRLRKGVEAVNSVMADIAVGLNDSDVQKVGSYWIVSGAYLLPTAPRMRRVFNRNSFDKGGRLYGWWQSLSSADRARLLLDGRPVVEPDYAQIHAQIIYALREISLVGDAYDTGEFPREFGKRGFNIAVNAKSRPGAVAAIGKELEIDRRTASKLLAAIEAKHKRVADIFWSDAGVGLMRIDSDITLEAVKQCQEQGIAVLPVHDSLIVQAGHADRAAEIMIKAFV